MHTQLDPLFGTPCDAQVLDAVAELLGIGDVTACDAADALGVDLVELQRHTEGDGGQDRQFVRRIDAFDVESGICLGIAERLGLGKHVGKLAALVAHLRKDEVAGAVDDARHPVDAVAGEPLAYRLDDGDAAGHRSFEGHHYARGAGCCENLVAMACDERLVGSDNMLAIGDGAKHQLACRLVAAEQFDDDLYLGMIDEREGIAADRYALQTADRRIPHLARGGVADADAATGAARDLLGIARQHVHRSAADGTEPQQSHVHRIHAPLCRVAGIRALRRKKSRIPRIACRVRCSFSISPKRT